MKTPQIAAIPLSAVLAALISMLAAPPVHAQTDFGGVTKKSMREKRADRLAKQRGDSTQKSNKEEAAPLYPEATRQQPDAQASRDNLKALQELQETYGSGDYAATIAAADKIASSKGANAYDKSFAYQMAGTAAASSKDEAKAADYFQKAVTANGLDNNNHYQVMYNLAITQNNLGKYDQGLKTLDQFMSETKSNTPEQLNLRGAMLMNLKRYPEAATVYQKLMDANPDDSSYLMNAAAAYQQAGQDDKATALLSKAQAGGALTDANQYRALYSTYLNANKADEARKVIEQGVAKGILKPDAELAKAYMIIGQKAYYDEDDATAIEMYKRAAPIAATGEAALNLAKVYAANDRTSEAKAAAKMALDKGVKDTAAAKKLAATGK